MYTQTLHLRNNHILKGLYISMYFFWKVEDNIFFEEHKVLPPAPLLQYLVCKECVLNHTSESLGLRGRYILTSWLLRKVYANLFIILCSRSKVVNIIPKDKCDFLSNVEVYQCRLDEIFLELSFFDHFPWCFRTVWSKGQIISLKWIQDKTKNAPNIFNVWEFFHFNFLPSRVSEESISGSFSLISSKCYWVILLGSMSHFSKSDCKPRCYKLISLIKMQLSKDVNFTGYVKNHRNFPK